MCVYIYIYSRTYVYALGGLTAGIGSRRPGRPTICCLRAGDSESRGCNSAPVHRPENQAALLSEARENTSWLPVRGNLALPEFSLYSLLNRWVEPTHLGKPICSAQVTKPCAGSSSSASQRPRNSSPRPPGGTGPPRLTGSIGREAQLLSLH